MSETGLENTIAENAAGPKKAGNETGNMEQHSIPDQIAADRYIESKKAARQTGLGIKLTKLSPGGTV